MIVYCHSDEPWPEVIKEAVGFSLSDLSECAYFIYCRRLAIFVFVSPTVLLCANCNFHGNVCIVVLLFGVSQ